MAQDPWKGFRRYAGTIGIPNGVLVRHAAQGNIFLEGRLLACITAKATLAEMLQISFLLRGLYLIVRLRPLALEQAILKELLGIWFAITL